MSNINYNTSLFKAYSKAMDERSEWIFKIQSNLLIVTSTMLAVMISLNNDATGSFYNHVFYLSSLILNSLCILFCGISIYENKVTCNKTVRTWSKQLNKPDHETLFYNNIAVVGSLKRNRFFLICEKCSYISFILFIISLTAYGITK